MSIIKNAKAIEVASPTLVEEPEVIRLILTWMRETLQRPLFYVLFALVVLIVGAYLCLSIIPEEDRLEAIGRMIDGGVSLVGYMFTVGSSVPTWIVASGGMIAVWYIISLRTTIKLQNERIADMAIEKADLHNMLERLAGKSIFQSSTLPHNNQQKYST